MRVIKGGKFLTGEQTARLAIAGAADRQKLIKLIANEMRTKDREAERRGPKR